MTELDRRQFLLAAATAAGAVAAAGTPALAGAAPAAQRTATYRALVRSLRRTDPRFRHADPGIAARAFARWYARQPALTRRHADAVLDRLRTGGVPAGAGLCPAPRDAAGARRCATVAAAIDLACVACEPPPAPDERPECVVPGAAA